MNLRRLLTPLLALALAGCPSEPSNSGDDEASGGGELPADPDANPLRRIGDIAAGHYLFGDVVAELISVELEHFNIAPDSGPHLQVLRDETWPSACLREATEIREGALVVSLAAGAPVFVLAADHERARVSIALHSEHSVIVRRAQLSVDGCRPEVALRAAHVRAPDAGDRACLFGHQETIEEFAGLALPTGVGLQVVRADGDWSLVRAALRGGTAEGWMAGALVAEGVGTEEVLWERGVLRDARCVFPGRVDSALGTSGSVAAGSEELPEARMRPSEVERAMARERPGVEACYEARRAALGDAEVHLPLEMTVDRDGRVVSARIAAGATTDAELRRCVLERAERWRFNPPQGGGSVGVRFTFHLQPPRPEPSEGEGEADAP